MTMGGVGPLTDNKPQRHSPRPWTKVDQGSGDWLIRAKNGFLIAQNNLIDGNDHPEESQANGELIANAPALLAEVDRLHFLVSTYRTKGGRKHNISGKLCPACSLIKKHRGISKFDIKD